jgi:HEPN domain-containing protein
VSRDIELDLDRFALASFRDIADQDYISARLSWRARLYQQFLWQSQQALEKYLKFLLLLHRIKATKVKHDLAEAMKLLQVNLPFQIEMADTSKEFVDMIDRVGQWRYAELSLVVEGPLVQRLDQTVWELRRYTSRGLARANNGPATPQRRDELISELRAAQGNRQAFHLANGRLERILADKSHPARAALVWKNMCYGAKRRESVRNVPTPFYVSNSPLSLRPELIELVRTYVYFPGELAKGYRELAFKQSSKPSKLKKKPPSSSP